MAVVVVRVRVRELGGLVCMPGAAGPELGVI